MDVEGLGLGFRVEGVEGVEVFRAFSFGILHGFRSVRGLNPY